MAMPAMRCYMACVICMYGKWQWGSQLSSHALPLCYGGYGMATQLLIELQILDSRSAAVVACGPHGDMVKFGDGDMEKHTQTPASGYR